MADFICKDPKATVRAANMLATLKAFKLVPQVVQPILESVDVDPDQLRPDQKIRVQQWLDALRMIYDKVGPTKLRDIGQRIIETGEFPPSFKDVPSVLLSIDEIYHLNHEGEVGHYICEREDEPTIKIECRTPYPRYFERGLIEGISRHPQLTGDKRYLVEYEDGPEKGDLTCTIRVREV